ncbi:MAG: NADH-quinone oxidoreductase subunit L [Candidatus Omnitrophota bacterium]|jgi:NADH-quinone oxidoreductase subunit L
MILLPCLIPLLPLAAFAVNLFFGKRLRARAAWVSVATSSISCLIAFYCIATVVRTGTMKAQWVWIMLENTPLRFGYLIDPLACVLLFVVTVVGTLIQVYSAGYMHDDPRFTRFFAYVSLFMSAMLTLVIASNYVLFFMAWEVMGLCSYFLIGFWFEKPSAADAGRKAFLVTRVGDVGFLAGLMTLFAVTRNLDFESLGASAQAGGPLLAVAALLIFCGTIGKSAQFPLHVWLPDAMEGPTPVSALIHAATMVAAGVYLVARSFPLFEIFPDVLTVVAITGTLTAFMAAFIALTATDIKKVLAYSTISQLGFMVAALGLKGYGAGTFHLMTHAFFKALLFLGADSVIHGTGTQDLREMGGLFGKMRHTALTFLAGSLAIAGVPPLSGFWSKDEILAAAYQSGHGIIYYVLLLTAFMTAFYMFRLVFMAFFGKPRSPGIHAHESPAVMTVPLWILAAGAVLIGLPGSPLMGNWLGRFLAGPHTHGEHALNLVVMFSSILAGLGGILLAWLFYVRAPQLPGIVARRASLLYRMSLNKLWFDEIYHVLIVRPFCFLADLLYGFDQKAIDGIVNETGLATVRTSRLKAWIDTYLVDGTVNLVGALVQLSSALVRRIQTGFVQHYLLMILAGILVLIFLEFRP